MSWVYCYIPNVNTYSNDSDHHTQEKQVNKVLKKNFLFSNNI